MIRCRCGDGIVCIYNKLGTFFVTVYNSHEHKTFVLASKLDSAFPLSTEHALEGDNYNGTVVPSIMLTTLIYTTRPGLCVHDVVVSS